MKRLLIAALVAGCTPAVHGPHDPPPAPFDAAGTLAEHLIGSFDSEQQSFDEPQYFAIQLITCAVEAPELGDQVLYVEQAVMDTPSQPYRQRLYVVAAGDGEHDATTTVYALTDPDAAIGLCGDDEVAAFAAADVFLREGCGAYLTYDPDEAVFAGGTMGEGCASTLQGAAYATSEITSTVNRLESWDRGFYDDGTQAWGATAGPYRFERR